MRWPFRAPVRDRRTAVTRLLLLGFILVVLMLVIWVVWGEALVARSRRARAADDAGLGD